MSIYRMLGRTLLLATFLATLPANAQQHRLVPLDHWAYAYVHRLQLRGYMLELHPTALPYTEGAIASALDGMKGKTLPPPLQRWVQRLDEAFGHDGTHDAPAESKEAHGASTGKATLQPGVHFASSTRFDPLRPSTADEDPAGETASRYTIAARLSLEHGPAVAQVGVRFDTFYRDDPDGLDAANRLITRNEDSYLGIGSRHVSAYAGRFRHHWAPVGETALVLSDNPVGFDQIHLRVGGGRLAIRSVLGELDSMTEDGRFTGTAGADSVGGSVRRYVASHRLDWRPSRYVAFTFMESTIYSGQNTDFSLKFFNPLALQAFSVDGRPKNDENNGLLAGMLWWQYGAWTFQGQVLLDDADLLHVSGEPISGAVSGSLTFAGLAHGEIGASMTAVTTRAYNTHQPEGRYTHLLRGIGAPYNDYVHASAHVTFYALYRGLDVILTPHLDLLLQGTATIHGPYPDSANEADTILDGIVQRVLRPALQLRVQHGHWLWGYLDAGPAFIASERHIEGNDRTAFAFRVGLMARFGSMRRFEGRL